MSSSYSELTRTICNIYYTILKTPGGFNFFCQNYRQLQDIHDTLENVSKHYLQTMKIDPSSLNKYIPKDYSFYGEQLDFRTSEQSEGNREEYCIQAGKLGHLIKHIFTAQEIVYKIYKGFNVPEKKYELL